MRRIVVPLLLPVMCVALAGLARAEGAIVVQPTRAVASLATEAKRVDHAAWHTLLKTYVNAKGLVN